jgi:hypothetical protein
MNIIRRIRRIAGVLTGLACAWLGLSAAAPAAFAAMSVPPPSGGSAAVAEHHESRTDGLPAPLAAHIHQLVHQAPGPVPVHTVVVGGVPGWQIALIAAAAALVAATVAVLVNRAWATRRKSAAAAA